LFTKYVLRALALSFVGQYKFFILIDRFDQAVDHAVVGRCAKQKEDHSSVWIAECNLFVDLLFARVY
jgi:hypothetical protein